MKITRSLLAAALVTTIVGLVWLDKTPRPVLQPVLEGASTVGMAALPTNAHLSTSWYCPGVPGGKLTASTGHFSITNSSESGFSAAVTIFPADGIPVMKTVEVAPRSRVTVTPADLSPSIIAAALIEMTGAVGAVEQTAITQEGMAVSPCALEPSSTWYFADGSTRVDASMNLTLFNPSPTDAVVDLAFADEDGPHPTKKFEGRVVPARRLVVIDVGQVIQRKERLSVAATVRGGTIVMGRFQVLRGEDGSRRGLVVDTAAPALATSWRFAAGQNGDAGEGTLPAKERIILHNPGEQDAVATITTFPATPAPVPSGSSSAGVAATPDPITVLVPARQSAVADLSAPSAKDQAVPLVAPGLFSTVVSSDQPVVVERALDRSFEGHQLATLQLGSPLGSTEWVLAGGAPSGSQATLAIVNVTGLAGTVTVKALSPAGLLPVPGLEAVALPAGALIRLPLDDKGVSPSSLVVTSTVEVVAERILRSAAAWSSSLGLPVAGP